MGARMREREKRWVRVRALTTEEKAAIATACERFIGDYAQASVSA